MPKTRSQTKKETTAHNQPENQLTGFTGNRVASVIDRSKFEIQNPMILEEKNMETKLMNKKPHYKSQARNQKKQKAMKRNIMNIQKNYRHKELQ